MNDTVENPATLLFVDDEASILSALRRLLRPAGHKIHTAESGKAGLEILERETVDRVISDMRMPEMDGAKFLEQVRARWPDVTRLLLTGYADVASIIEAINRGEIYRYIAKPWDDNDLTLIIRDALERRRLQGENAHLLTLTQRQNEQLRELNASLEQKVRARTDELEQANSFLNLANDKLKQNFLVSIKMFSGLMELRGGAMAGHSRRVADLARNSRCSSLLGGPKPELGLEQTVVPATDLRTGMVLARDLVGRDGCCCWRRTTSLMPVWSGRSRTTRGARDSP